MKVSELTGAKLDAAVAKAGGFGECMKGKHLAFSSDWGSGGPIIEREQISLHPFYLGTQDRGWEAAVKPALTPEHELEFIEGPTPLVAAMRAFVSANLGDEIGDV